MDASQIAVFDPSRLFVGGQPALFYLEIIMRTLVIYGWTLALIRWIGGHSISQLSLVDFVLVIALGSAVGDAMFYAEVPLLQAMLVVAIVIGSTKFLERAALRSPTLGAMIDDPPVEVVRDGKLVMKALRARNMSQETLFQMLRLRDVTNLGEIRAAWIEPSGAISLLRAEAATAGLPIMPPPAIAPPAEAVSGPRICTCCARPAEADEECCSDCGNDRFTAPVHGARI